MFLKGFSGNIKLFNNILAMGTVLFCSQSAMAQSLDPNAPGPLKAGINSSTADSTVGTQYWYYDADPGQHSVKVTFQSMGVLGAPMKNTLAVTLSSPLGAEKKLCTSESTPESIVFSGKMLKTMRMVVRVDPLSPTGLIRQGGDYQIEVTGAVHFGGGASGATGAAPSGPATSNASSGQDQIVRAYAAMLNDWGITKFHPDGAVTASDGTVGKWKLEDADTQSYTVFLGHDHLSLIFMQGRGLVQADSKDMVIFKQMK